MKRAISSSSMPEDIEEHNLQPTEGPTNRVSSSPRNVHEPEPSVAAFIPPETPYNTPRTLDLVTTVDLFQKSLNQYTAKCVQNTFTANASTGYVVSTNTPKYTALERFNSGPYVSRCRQALTFQKKKVLAGLE